jgi:hypothetical protein
MLIAHQSGVYSTRPVATHRVGGWLQEPLQAWAGVCLLVLCICGDRVWWDFFWQLDVRDHFLFCLEEEGLVFEGLRVFLVCEGLCALHSLPLQQLQLSAEALARSFLSSLMGSGNSLYSSTSVSWTARKRKVGDSGIGTLQFSAWALSALEWHTSAQTQQGVETEPNRPGRTCRSRHALWGRSQVAQRPHPADRCFLYGL